MGCGCQDKERDAEIIAYYERKKAMMQQEFTPPPVMVNKIIWEGHLSDYLFYVGGDENIVKIEKVDGKWEATVIQPVTDI